MSRIIRADLHVHTCLSPCGDLRMSPKKIVAKAIYHEIDVIAICDHNSAENVPALLRAAHGTPLIVLPGMEVCTKEEVHVIALFDNVESAIALQRHVYARLYGENDPDAFGTQVVSNEDDELLGFNPRLLIGAVDISIEQIIEITHSLGGLAVASHIDRPSYSVISQLGFIPDTIKFDALEISPNLSIKEARNKFSGYSNYAFIKNSDAHFIDDFGETYSEYEVEAAALTEIAMAMRGEGGRRIIQ